MGDVTNRDELEAELARKLGKLFKVQMGRLLELMGDPPDINRVPPEFWEESGKEFNAVVIPFLERQFLAQAEAMLTAGAIGVEWALVNERAISWARAYGYDLVRGINETSRAVLRKAVSAFFDQGLNRGQLEGMLTGTFGPVRAEMIAVTEVTRSSVQGERALADEIAQQGIRMVEVWQTRNDELVCPICGPRHLKPEGDGWSKNDGPPAHPRCRCFTTHEFAKVEE